MLGNILTFTITTLQRDKNQKENLFTFVVDRKINDFMTYKHKYRICCGSKKITLLREKFKVLFSEVLRLNNESKINPK